MLKLNVCRGVCSSGRLDTDIFIGTSVLNCQTLKTVLLQILVIKRIFSRKMGGIHFFSSTSEAKIPSKRASNALRKVFARPESF